MQCVEKTFIVNDKQFSAKLWGDSAGLPVIALHGWLDNCASFDAVAPKMKGLNILALDMAGHGRSDHRSADAHYHIWDDISEILQIADLMQWPQFAILGHSRGAIIGTIIGSMFPERIIALGLIEGLWPQTCDVDDSLDQLKRAVLAELQPVRAYKRYDSLEMMAKTRQRVNFALQPESAMCLVERGSQADGAEFVWRHDMRLRSPSSMMLTNAHVAVVLENINVPLYLILAEQGIPMIDPNFEQRILPYNFNYEILPGGHHLHMEQSAKQVAEKLMLFYQENV